MNDDQKHDQEDSLLNEDSSQSSTSEPSIKEKESVDNSPEESTKESWFRTYASYFANNAIWTNIILAGLFANSIYLFYHDYDINHRFSSLLMMIQVSCLVLFFLIRVAPSKISMSPTEWVVAITGTILPLLISPVDSTHEIIPLMILQFLGIIISTIGIISLNSSFGIVPAIRNIKTKGLYSLVRHPIYFGYFISITCIVIQNFTMLNIALIIAIITMDIYRIIAEERLLSTNSEYQLYMERVKWRLLPFIW